MKLLSEYKLSHGRVRHYEMNNGLQIILLPDTSAPVFAYQTWFRVGSRHEKLGKTGIAHLFEHLMFNESANLKPGEFDRLLELQGGHINAATWVDWTYYQNDLPSTELELIIRLEAERMANLVLHDPQLESEREVVINERRFRVEDDVDGFLSEELFRLAFEKHPYHWPTIGFMNDIRAITTEDALAFYRTYYAPNNATIVIVGDIEETQTLALVEKYYGAMKAQSIPSDNFSPEPLQTHERRACYEKPVVTEKLLMGYKGPAFTDSDHLYLQLLSDILAGGASSRLYRHLVIEKEMTSWIRMSVTPFHDPGLIEFSASVHRNHSAKAVEEVIQAFIGDMQSQGPTAEELERAKARFLTHFFLELRSTHGRAEGLGQYAVIAGDYRQLFTLPEKLQHATAQNIQDVARRYLNMQQCTVVMAVPTVSTPVEKL